MRAAALPFWILPMKSLQKASQEAALGGVEATRESMSSSFWLGAGTPEPRRFAGREQEETKRGSKEGNFPFPLQSEETRAKPPEVGDWSSLSVSNTQETTG